MDPPITVMQTPRRILLIDDEPDVRRIIQICLEKIACWTVTVAASGEEGLRMAATEHPDAIVLDIMMPGMNGYQVLALLLIQPSTRSIPVVLLTAKADSLQSMQHLALSVKGIIGKPFSPLTLHQDIARALGWMV